MTFVASSGRALFFSSSLAWSTAVSKSGAYCLTVLTLKWSLPTSFWISLAILRVFPEWGIGDQHFGFGHAFQFALLCMANFRCTQKHEEYKQYFHRVCFPFNTDTNPGFESCKQTRLPRFLTIAFTGIMGDTIQLNSCPFIPCSCSGKVPPC